MKSNVTENYYLVDKEYASNPSSSWPNSIKSIENYSTYSGVRSDGVYGSGDWHYGLIGVEQSTKKQFGDYESSTKFAWYGGKDIAQFNQSKSSYTVSIKDSIVAVKANDSQKSFSDLNDVCRFKFADTYLAADIDGNAGCVVKLIGAVFGKEAIHNKQYVGIGLDLMDKGMSYKDLAGFALKVKGAAGYDHVIDTLWTNVVGNTPSSAEKAPYVELLKNGMDSGSLAVLAAESYVNCANVDIVGLSKTGIEYVF